MAAKLDPSLPSFIIRLREELRRRLSKEAGISSRVEAEAVPGTRVFRIYIVAAGFSELGHTERQDLVWRIARTVLQPQEELRVIILTLSAEEARGSEIPTTTARLTKA